MPLNKRLFNPSHGDFSKRLLFGDFKVGSFSDIHVAIEIACFFFLNDIYLYSQKSVRQISTGDLRVEELAMSASRFASP